MLGFMEHSKDSRSVVKHREDLGRAPTMMDDGALAQLSPIVMPSLSGMLDEI